jgi:hypothetical protein
MKFNKRNLKHGETTKYHAPRLYRLWKNIRSRCGNKNIESYKWYGALGVSVCPQWMKYEDFAKWARSNGYADHLQIDRINPYGNYEPSNCRFVTASVNTANRRMLKGFKYGTSKRANGKYRVQIKVRCKLIHLGTFNSFEEAKSVYLDARKKHFGLDEPALRG